MFRGSKGVNSKKKISTKKFCENKHSIVSHLFMYLGLVSGAQVLQFVQVDYPPYTHKFEYPHPVSNILLTSSYALNIPLLSKTHPTLKSSLPPSISPSLLQIYWTKENTPRILQIPQIAVYCIILWKIFP